MRFHQSFQVEYYILGCKLSKGVYISLPLATVDFGQILVRILSGNIKNFGLQISRLILR